MTTATAPTEPMRDEKASIFVPSRYGNGQPIPPEARDNQIRIVAGVLARVFGGASAEEIASNKNRIVGTFRHEVDRSERFVDEEVYRVWAAATAEQMGDASQRTAVLEEAGRLRDALGQECVLVEWGREVLFTPSVNQPATAVRFGALSRSVQEEFALMAWHRVAKPEDLCGVLSLAGWSFPKDSKAIQSEPAGRSKIAWLEGKPERVAWLWQSSDLPQEEDLKVLAAGDLLVKRMPDAKLRVWLRTKKQWEGPRDIPLATDERPTTRLAIEFVISLLEGDSKLSLAQLLEAEGATARFYRVIRDQIAAVAAAVPGAQKAQANEIAQRLLGRMLFLRFVEEKGWLPRENLLTQWRDLNGNYYRDVLLRLFTTLNTPDETGTREVPYLNGGLFEVRPEEDAINLPDALFDPGSKRPSVLRVLYDYQFTLDEAAARDQVVSVDPAMLGRVLESLTPDEKRKRKGVHYTPAPIAKALAVGGILPQVVRRARALGVADIDGAVLERLRAGDHRAVDVRTAERLQEALRALKIVDPAVGSGALLVACLEVLLELEAGCERVLGGDLRKGSRNWALRARHFVKECLYGVDISPEAIEVARLRFWLFLAVGEQSPTALPDLGYNLRVGDSLAFDVAEESLARELAQREGGTRTLEFDRVDRALNAALDARRRFSDSAEGAPNERREAYVALEEAERQLRAALGGRLGRHGEPPPFAWTVHYPEVFQGPNHGFDLVIANPPYVRTGGLAPGDAAALKERYRSMKSRNVDLYYAFVERALRPPIPRNEQGANENLRGLAGRAGGVAFIMPSFAQTQSAEALRNILDEGAHIERWVDFLGLQVFQTASNYVALLFATAERRRRRTFAAQIVTPEAFARMRANQPWLDRLRPTQVQYRAGGWSIRPQINSRPGETRLLQEVATVQVGIQTSLDSFYLFDLIRPGDDPSLVVVKNERDEVVLERAALFPCAKGSREMHGDRINQGCFVLWPYNPDGSLMTREALKAKFPRAWKYLLANRARLEEREKGKFKVPDWWRFRRPQGVKCATQPKILIPSMMKEPTAFFDPEGRVICTASGKGGGGGWVLQPAEGTNTNMVTLAQYLRSAEYGEWLRANAEAKKGGWWGVDRKTLKGCPVPNAVL